MQSIYRGAFQTNVTGSVTVQHNSIHSHLDGVLNASMNSVGDRYIIGDCLDCLDDYGMFQSITIFLRMNRWASGSGVG